MTYDQSKPPVPGKKPYDSIYRPSILKDVKNEDLWNFAKEQETLIQHLYKDTEDNITVGIGKIVPNVEKAQELVFDVMKDRKTPIRRATKREIEKAFKKVEKAPKGQTANNYDPFADAQFDKLYMPNEIVHRE